MPQALIPVEFLPADETPAALVAWLRQHNVERAGWVVYEFGDEPTQGEEWVFPTEVADNLMYVWDELFGALWRLVIRSRPTSRRVNLAQRRHWGTPQNRRGLRGNTR